MIKEKKKYYIQMSLKEHSSPMDLHLISKQGAAQTGEVEGSATCWACGSFLCRMKRQEAEWRMQPDHCVTHPTLKPTPGAYTWWLKVPCGTSCADI